VFWVAALLATLRPAVRVGLVALVVGAGAAAGTWFLRPDMYTAYALLRIAPVEQRILDDPSATGKTETGPGNAPAPLVPAGLYQKTQLALITSRPVIQAALNPPPAKADPIKIDHLPLIKQQEDPVEWLGNNLKAELVDNTEILRLSLSARHLQGDPQLNDDLKVVVNAVVDAYMDQIVKGEHGQQRVLLADTDKGRVSVIEPAEPATVLDKKARFHEAGSAALVGLFLGAVGMVCLERRNRSIRGRKDLPSFQRTRAPRTSFNEHFPPPDTPADNNEPSRGDERPAREVNGESIGG
jgi:uncharacterized protein involved in exopolysaccharide biosynthesis